MSFTSIPKRAKAFINDKKSSVCFFTAPLLLSFIIINMALFYGNTFATFYADSLWIFKIFFTYLFVLSLQGLVFALCHKGFLSFLITAVFSYALDFTNQTMCATTGEPLLPTDILMVGQFKKIAGYVSIPLTVSEIVGFCAIALICILYFLAVRKEKKIPFSKKFKRLSSAIFLCFFLLYSYFFCISYNFRYNVLKGCNVHISAFNATEDYISSGCILSFFPKIGEMFVHTPPNYSQKSVEKIISKYNDGKPAEATVKPSIIAIQNEAWWDPTLLEGVTFSKDPLKSFRTYSKDTRYAKTGKLVTPVFAGGTCLPEFEFLTGFSTLNLPSNTYPYIQAVAPTTPSFVKELKKNGYSTVAIHPYIKNFYSRDVAYKDLGFEKFLGEDDMKHQEKRGVYISDYSVAREIISVYEEKGSENIFIFGVTMQNHGGYNYFRYDQYDIDVKCPDLNYDDLIGLKDYTQGVYDAMNAFDLLTNYFKDVSQPVLIVMYGDHLPLLGISGSTYINGGMVTNKNGHNYTDDEKFYHTPYIIWANYDISRWEIEEYLSPATLGMEVYEQSAPKEIPPYYQMFRFMFEKIPVYHHKGIYASGYKKYDAVTEEKYGYLINEYKLISHDLLHGDGYLHKYQKGM